MSLNGFFKTKILTWFYNVEKVILREEVIRLQFFIKCMRFILAVEINPCDILFKAMNQLPINIRADSISEQLAAPWEKERQIWGHHWVSWTVCSSFWAMLQIYLFIPCPVWLTLNYHKFPKGPMEFHEFKVCHKLNDS